MLGVCDEELRHSEIKLIHLDLKTCPLKMNYLKQLFKQFGEWGGTGLLLEWEDTFPYKDDLIDIGSVGHAAYTPDEIQEILSFAKQHSLLAVPLVQTFGHLEFALKTSKWRYLREVPKYCSSICPSNPDSFYLVSSMIIQIMNLHVDSKFVHIGGDEVWHMGICDTCKTQNKQYLFLKHILKIVRFIRNRYPQITIIMWDDMLRGIDVDVLKEFNLGDFVEPMIWQYNRAETFTLGPELWDKYAQIFEKIWIASAFKGATGSCQLSPIIGHHVSNHEKWLEIIAQYGSKFKCVRGIALTGWSRYDHYAVLCELMPAGLPSLALCLSTWINGKCDKDVYQQVSSLLGFTEEAPLLLCSVNRPIPIPKELNFPSSQIYIGIEWFMNVRSRFNFIAYSDQSVTWFNPWNVKRNHTSAMQIEHVIVGFRSLLHELQTIEKFLRAHMLEAFYDDTVEEWFGCYLHPLTEKLLALVNDAESQLKLEQ